MKLERESICKSKNRVLKKISHWKCYETHYFHIFVFGEFRVKKEKEWNEL